MASTMCKFAPLATALLILGTLAQAQTVDFVLHTYPDSPIVFAGDNTRAAAPGVPHRQFVTIRNQSKKSVAGVIFQQTAADGSKTGIVAIEHVGIVMVAGEKKRVTISVEDVRKKTPAGRPVLSVVAVEFLDGTLWNAPSPPAQ
jgi:hypothetical protein